MCNFCFLLVSRCYTWAGKFEANPPVLAVCATVCPSSLNLFTELVASELPPIARLFCPGVVKDPIPNRASSSFLNFSSAINKRDSIIPQCKEIYSQNTTLNAYFFRLLSFKRQYLSHYYLLLWFWLICITLYTMILHTFH